jgi:hypothetical protein
MFLLEIGCHSVTHKIMFADLASAQEQLDLLKPKMGGEYDRLCRNGTEEVTHTIKSPAGDFVAVLSKIETARVLDMSEHYQLAEYVNNTNIWWEAKRARSIKEAELAAGAA